MNSNYTHRYQIIYDTDNLFHCNLVIRFEPKICLKREGCVVINTGNFLHSISVDIEALGTIQVSQSGYQKDLGTDQVSWFGYQEDLLKNQVSQCGYQEDLGTHQVSQCGYQEDLGTDQVSRC